MTTKLARCMYCHEPVTTKEYLEDHAEAKCGGTKHIPVKKEAPKDDE